MNRLTNYFEGAKLARLLLQQAEESAHKGHETVALKHLIASQRELITAMNNVASLAFKTKPRRRARVVSVDPYLPTHRFISSAEVA